MQSNLIACLPCIPDGFELVTEGKIESSDEFCFPLDPPSFKGSNIEWRGTYALLNGYNIVAKDAEDFTPVIRKIK